MDQRESSFPFLLIQVTKKVLMQLFLRRLKKHFGLVNFSFFERTKPTTESELASTMSSFASKTPAFTDKLHSHYSTKDECFLHHRFECNIELSFCYRNFVPEILFQIRPKAEKSLVREIANFGWKAVYNSWPYFQRTECFSNYVGFVQLFVHFLREIR